MNAEEFLSKIRPASTATRTRATTLSKEKYEVLLKADKKCKPKAVEVDIKDAEEFFEVELVTQSRSTGATAQKLARILNSAEAQYGDPEKFYWKAGAIKRNGEIVAVKFTRLQKEQ